MFAAQIARAAFAPRTRLGWQLCCWRRSFVSATTRDAVHDTTRAVRSIRLLGFFSSSAHNVGLRRRVRTHACVAPVSNNSCPQYPRSHRTLTPLFLEVQESALYRSRIYPTRGAYQVYCRTCEYIRTYLLHGPIRSATLRHAPWAQLPHLHTPIIISALVPLYPCLLQPILIRSLQRRTARGSNCTQLAPSRASYHRFRR